MLPSVPGDSTPHPKLHLALLKKGECAIVVGFTVDDDTEHELKMRLMELGFTAGEKIRVVAHGFPDGNPIAVRIGNTTFALRRHEAAMLQVVRDDATNNSQSFISPS